MTRKMSAAKKPAAKKPAAKKPAAKKPAAKKPAAKKPAAKKPAAKKPAATQKKPAFNKAVAWDTLKHAYGSASDLPARFAALASARAEERAAAIDAIHASICHQETFYSATPPAVAALLEIVARPSTEDKAAILALLVEIATNGDAHTALLDALDGPARRKLPDLRARAIDAAQAGFDTYVALLRDPDPHARAAAATAVAWSGRPSDASAPLLDALTRETDSTARASLAIALGLVARLSRQPAQVDAIAPMLADRALVVRASAAIAYAIARGPELGDTATAVLAEAVRTPDLLETRVPWNNGMLVTLAMLLIARLRATPALDDALLAVVERGGTIAAIAARLIAPRLLGPERPLRSVPPPEGEHVRRDREEDRALASLPISVDDLEPRQRRYLEALARHGEVALDGLVTEALALRGYPYTPRLVRRFLSGEGPTPSILDQPWPRDPSRTLADAYVEVAGRDDRVAAVEELVETLGGATALELALAAFVDLDVAPVLAFDVAWIAGPKAGDAIEKARARFVTEGVPTRRERDSGTMTFDGVFVTVALAEIAAAVARGDTPAAWVDDWLQHANGLHPRVLAALGTLPLERRERWVLDPRRDDNPFPMGSWSGAWDYWNIAPTPAVVARALEHAARWEPNEARARFHVPALVALRDAARAAGTDTATLDATLASFASTPPPRKRR